MFTHLIPPNCPHFTEASVEVYRSYVILTIIKQPKFMWMFGFKVSFFPSLLNGKLHSVVLELLIYKFHLRMNEKILNVLGEWWLLVHAVWLAWGGVGIEMMLSFERQKWKGWDREEYGKQRLCPQFLIRKE